MRCRNTPEQDAILNWFRWSSVKTTTICRAYLEVARNQGTCIFIAFNKDVVEERVDADVSSKKEASTRVLGGDKSKEDCRVQAGPRQRPITSSQRMRLEKTASRALQNSTDDQTTWSATGRIISVAIYHAEESVPRRTSRMWRRKSPN